MGEVPGRECCTPEIYRAPDSISHYNPPFGYERLRVVITQLHDQGEDSIGVKERQYRKHYVPFRPRQRGAGYIVGNKFEPKSTHSCKKILHPLIFFYCVLYGREDSTAMLRSFVIHTTCPPRFGTFLMIGTA